MVTSPPPLAERRAREIFLDKQQRVFRATDRMFGALMIVQWAFAIVLALALTPGTWTGTESATHPHVWAALVFGGVLTTVPVLLAVFRSGTVVSRYTIAVTQMCMGALLIHLTGGRIETHFHIFGSLAFLAFYRDWRVLVPATARRRRGPRRARHLLAPVGLRHRRSQPVAVAGARRRGSCSRTSCSSSPAYGRSRGCGRALCGQRKWKAARVTSPATS